MILFVCDRNASLSPMAEAIAAHLAPQLNIQSAGRIATHVRAGVGRVLQEDRIFSNGLVSKAIQSVDWDEVKLVVALVPEGDGPRVPSRYKCHRWSLPDPLWAPQEEREEAMRDLRDELKRRIEKLYKELEL